VVVCNQSREDVTNNDIEMSGSLEYLMVRDIKERTTVEHEKKMMVL
jgi:hypothetical protein